MFVTAFRTVTFIVYHFFSNLSSTFFKFFQIFFSVIPLLPLTFSSASAFLLYHFQTSLSIPFPKFFQAPVGFLSFSPDKLSFNSRISLPRSTALSLYHYFLRLSRKKLHRITSFFCIKSTSHAPIVHDLCFWGYYKSTSAL